MKDSLAILSDEDFWLGDLDSNQDSQIQSLESYQLDDLPTVGLIPTPPGPTPGRNKKESQQVPADRDSHDSAYLI